MKETVISYQSSVISRQRSAFSFQLSATGNTAKLSAVMAALCLFVVLFSPPFTPSCLAADSEVTIVSDTIEYFPELKKYVAKGSVKIVKEDATLEADQMVYFEETSDASAEGNVRYDDSLASFTAGSAMLNMDRKTGKLYEADIFFKEDNYHLKGKEIVRKAENEYYSREETNFTTCDGPVAAWCFRGHDMDLVVGQQVTGSDMTFRVRDVPVLYSPYLWAPATAERKTGFLIPSVSSSSSRGVGVNIPFFWAISENRDATFVLDAYSRQGVGGGLEYRFIEPRNLSSVWWIYNMMDNDQHRNFTEFRAVHDDRSSGGIGLFLNANIVNERDFYREIRTHREFYRDISPVKDKDLQRFLETSAEINMPFSNSRAYVLGQYWMDLKYRTGDVSQKLPEAGFVLNYTRFGSFMVSGNAAAANFWNRDGNSVRRFEVTPRILHAAGDELVLSQIASIRATAYDFSRSAGFGSNNENLAFEYDGSLHSRFVRRYDSFTHVVEPTLRYHYISNSPNSHSYVFDEWELQGRTSRLEFSLLNRALVRGSEMLAARITQPVDMNRGARPFMPLEFELGTQKPLPAKVSAAYDFNKGKIQSVTSDIKIPFTHGNLNFGQRYNMTDNIMVFRAGVNVQPIKPMQVGMDVRYDAKGEGMRAVGAYVQYSSQCWGVRLEAIKKPGDFTVQVKFDLFGVTAKPPKDL